MKKSYSTNGSQTIFPIPFPFDDPSHIEVWIRNNTTKLQDKLVNPGDYTVPPEAGPGSGSNVIMNDVWPAGYTIWIYRIHPETQTLDLIENDNLPAESLEKRLDKLTQMVQQLQEQLSRALLFPKTSPYGNLIHPEPEEDKFLVWKGGILVNGERFISSSDSTIQAFMKTFLESLTAAIARANLGTVGVDHDHVGGDGAAITETAITLADNTTLDVTTSKHGLVPKAPNDVDKFLAGDGTFDQLDKIIDADGDTHVKVETSSDVDQIVSTVAGIIAQKIYSDGAIDMPLQSSFSAYNSGTQSITGWTKLQLPTEVFDIQGEFNTTTYRFTAEKAGRYMFTMGVSANGITATNTIIAMLYRNSGSTPAGVRQVAPSTCILWCVGITILDLAPNDYVEAYAYFSATFNTEANSSFFAGHKLS